jgi:hypothetical protein
LGHSLDIQATDVRISETIHTYCRVRCLRPLAQWVAGIYSIATSKQDEPYVSHVHNLVTSITAKWKTRRSETRTALSIITAPTIVAQLQQPENRDYSSLSPILHYKLVVGFFNTKQYYDILLCCIALPPRTGSDFPKDSCNYLKRIRPQIA